MTVTVRRDNRLDDAPMTPVMCRRCGAGVQVRKSSWQQTSVQWTDMAMRRCEERCEAASLTTGTRPMLFLACSALSDSIANAVRTGTLALVDESR